MTKEKTDFDLSQLSLDELIKVYKNIEEFLDFLEEAKVSEEED